MIRPDDIEPKALAGTLWRYRWAVALTALVCGCLLYGYSLFLADSFEASTLVLVDDQRTSSSYVKEMVRTDLDGRMQTIQDQVMSRTNLERIIDEFGLADASGAPWENRIKSLRHRIEVSTNGDEAFRISYTDTDPVRAKEITNRLASLFIAANSVTREQGARGTVAALEEQLTSLRQRLDEQERQIRDFKAEKMGRLPEQLSSNLSSLNRMQAQLQGNATALSAARERQMQLEQMLDRPGRSRSTARELARELVSGRGATEDLRMALATQPPPVKLEVLKLQREALLSRVTPRHPDVQALDQEIAGLEKLIAEAPGDGTADAEMPIEAPADGSGGVAAQLSATKREIQGLLEERRELERKIDLYQDRVEAAPRVEQQLSELSRDYGTLTDRYEELLQRKLDAQLAGNAERQRISPFRVVDPAAVPEKKTAPTRKNYLILGFVLGTGLALGAAVLRETIWQPLHTADEIERHLGLPVLSKIPSISHRQRRWRRAITRGAVIVGVGAVVSAVAILHFYLRSGA